MNSQIGSRRRRRRYVEGQSNSGEWSREKGLRSPSGSTESRLYKRVMSVEWEGVHFRKYMYSNTVYMLDQTPLLYKGALK